ncbi:MAG: phenylalanine--tRNA ligase subunit beta [Actinomycetota bacterium]|nr:phenylalanine--tRNA ligase subunit beta [Actinomycetota bacterium]
MRVPLSWLREHVDLPAEVSARDVADRLIDAGLEVEGVHALGQDVTGPLVVGQVLDLTEEEHKNGKTIRWCTVSVGEDAPRGIVCGARNFAVGDRVVVALPGAVLPGGFAISARKTYGHVSDGMICSSRELGLGDDHSGILVLGSGPAPGADAYDVLQLRDDVLDIAVTPDRGYCMSVRGIAREAATAYGVDFHDPGRRDEPAGEASGGGGWPVKIRDLDACAMFVALRVCGFDPTAASPPWLQRRVALAGMRPISLAVDVTNYVMLELGQPLHAYDAARLEGPIVVRRASAGEKLETLDGVARSLDAADLLITDDSGPIGIAGVMGGASTEISATTADIVLEAAWFDPGTISRSSRRHRLPSEASRRFERGVDGALAPVAGRRAAQLLAELGGGRVLEDPTIAGQPVHPAPVRLRADEATRLGGRQVDTATVVRRLVDVGCAVDPGDGDVLAVTPPSWRPDLLGPADLVEEILRLEGYDAIPSRLPTAPAGRGLTPSQRAVRRVGRALADAGYVETPAYPFVREDVWDALGLPADDARRNALRVANPISTEEPLLRTTLLPGLLATLRRNVGRGMPDAAVFEIGTVFRPDPGQATTAPRLPVDRRPTAEELVGQDAALPRQPRRVAVALSGHRERVGWWGPGRAACWADAVEAAREVARAVGVELEVRADQHAPWHPGRCAALYVDAQLVGHAGELHPRVVTALDLPARTSAMELDLDRMGLDRLRIAQAPVLSTYPVAIQDVALVVASDVPAAQVERALRAGAGPLLEAVRLFDVYVGEQVGGGRKSLAYTLRFRAPDRTLTVEEASAARDAAVAEATRVTGAVQRGV